TRLRLLQFRAGARVTRGVASVSASAPPVIATGRVAFFSGVSLAIQRSQRREGKRSWSQRVTEYLNNGAVEQRRQPAEGAGEIWGRSPGEGTRAVWKLRHLSSGIAATAINASWLIMNPTSHGNAFCMKP